MLPVRLVDTKPQLRVVRIGNVWFVVLHDVAS